MTINELINKIKFIVLTPGKAFADLKKEKNIKLAVSFYAVLSLINLIIYVLITYLFPKTNAVASLNLQNGAFYVVTYIFGIIFSFVIARITHFWIKLFKGKGDFKNTYQLIVYSQTPTLLLGFFPAISFIGWIYELVIFIRGTEVLHGFNRKKALLVVFLPRLILTLVFIGVAAYLFYLPALGEMKLN